MARRTNKIPTWSKRHWEVLDFGAGPALNPTEIKKLEQILETAPDDWEARILLLGKFGHARFFRHKKERVAEAQQKFLCHLKWMIENHPDHEDLSMATFMMKDEPGFKEIRELWEKTIDENLENVKVLSNAAHFFRVQHFEETEKIRKHILKLEPNNKDPYFELSSMYELRATIATRSIEQKGFTKKAIEQFQQGWQIFLTNPDEPWHGTWRIHPHTFERLMEIAGQFKLSEEIKWLVDARETRIEQLTIGPEAWPKTNNDPPP